MANQNKYSAKLNCEQKIDILRKNWLSHDARWQMAIVKKLGWEKGNKINKAIIKDMGKVMMQRLLNVIGVKKITNINDYIEICYTAMELYYPSPSMKYTFKKISENEISGIIEKCIIYDQVKKMKVDNFYECGCFSMRAGW
ncbi:MAG: hypothetical protein KGD57_04075, partial [Candidatus Lokiarchaeota archaeon]|nr:hypothetical protein [Candidatus Lokiarchaeota archaeon]